MKLRLPKNRRYRFALYLVSTFLILLAVDLLWVRYWRIIHIGYDTTRITSPLTPSGNVDYFRAVDERFSAGITPENNAAPLLLAAVGPEGGLSPQVASRVYARLGMQPLPEKGDYFLPAPAYKKHDPYMAVDKYAYLNELAIYSPAHGGDDPDFMAWLQSNQHPLELLIAASHRPRYFIPLLTTDPKDDLLLFILLPKLGSFRSLGNSASASAIHHFDQGNFSAAREELLAIFRFARLVGQSPTVIARLAAIGIESRACLTVSILADTEKLSAGEAKQLLADLSALSPLPTITETVDADERLYILDVLSHAAKEGPRNTYLKILPGGEESSPSKLLMNLIPTHFDNAMRLTNHFYDAYVAAAQAPTCAQRIASGLEVERRIDEEFRSSNSQLNPATMLVVILLPAMARAQTLYEREQARLDLARVSLALAAYRADHQQYPATLAQLAPEYLPVIPPDHFNDQPLHYTPNPAGQSSGYLLYSVGDNMKDDKGFGIGRPNPANRNADDIVIQIPRLPATPPTTQPH